MTENKIRKVQLQDLTGLKEILDSNELFPSEYLDEMISDYFNNKDTEDIWFTYIYNSKPIGLGYCAPEKFTTWTYNLYAIAVHKEFQGQGIRQKMMSFIEKLLIENGMRILIVETSSIDRYTMTRNFYHKLGYKQEAVIKDFWNEGESKVIFRRNYNK